MIIVFEMNKYKVKIIKFDQLYVLKFKYTNINNHLT